MAVVTAIDMKSFRTKLQAINEKAFNEVYQYLLAHNYDIDDSFIDFCHAITTKYGEAAGELSCQLYDETVSYWKKVHASKKAFAPAEPAPVPTRSEVEKAVYGTMKTSSKEIPGAVQRLVKLTAEDTKIKNGMRDGAYFAWVPSGDACAFCLTLASNGWQKIGKNTLKNGHAEHIHANCNCTYAISLDAVDQYDSNVVKGYAPRLYEREYNSVRGDNSKETLRNLRQKLYNESKIGKYGDEAS